MEDKTLISLRRILRDVQTGNQVRITTIKECESQREIIRQLTERGLSIIDGQKRARPHQDTLEI